MEEKILSAIQGLRNYGVEPSAIAMPLRSFLQIADSPRLREGQEIFGLKVEIRADIEQEFIIQ